MPRNQTSTKTNGTGATGASATKPRAPRVTASKHSKSSAPAASEAVDATLMVKDETAEEVEVIIASLTESPVESISKLAYGYWEQRGRHGGDALADWVRAEEEYRHSLTAL